MEENNTQKQSPSRSRANNRRSTRTPLHSRNILTVQDKDPELEYRWFNDVEERLFHAKNAGWEFVTDKGITVGDPTVNASTEVGSVVSKKVGGGVVAYLMALPKEFYEEDQEAKQDKVDRQERAMYEELNSPQDGRYGNVDIGSRSED